MTASRWLKKMGYVYDNYKKGLYFDGHERDDVVEYRRKFLEQMEL